MKKIIEYTEADFNACGYTKYDSDEHRYSDYMYSKTFYDEMGKKYFIHLLHYTAIKFSNGLTLAESYSAEMAFQNSDPYTIVNYDRIGDFLLSDIEDRVEKLWEHIGKPYYEKYLVEK